MIQSPASVTARDLVRCQRCGWILAERQGVRMLYIKRVGIVSVPAELHCPRGCRQPTAVDIGATTGV